MRCPLCKEHVQDKETLQVHYITSCAGYHGEQEAPSSGSSVQFHGKNTGPCTVRFLWKKSVLTSESTVFLFSTFDQVVLCREQSTDLFQSQPVEVKVGTYSDCQLVIAGDLYPTRPIIVEGYNKVIDVTIASGSHGNTEQLKQKSSVMPTMAQDNQGQHQASFREYGSSETLAVFATPPGMLAPHILRPLPEEPRSRAPVSQSLPEAKSWTGTSEDRHSFQYQHPRHWESPTFTRTTQTQRETQRWSAASQDPYSSQAVRPSHTGESSIGAAPSQPLPEARSWSGMSEDHHSFQGLHPRQVAESPTFSPTTRSQTEIPSWTPISQDRYSFQVLHPPRTGESRIGAAASQPLPATRSLDRLPPDFSRRESRDDQTADLRRINEDLQDERSELNFQLQGYRQTMKECRRELDQKDSAIHELEWSMKELKTQQERAENSLHDEITKCKQENEQLQRERMEMRREREQLVSKVSDTEEQLRQARREFNQAKTDKTYLEGELIHHASQLEQKETKLCELEFSMEEMKIQREQAEKSRLDTISNLRQENQQLLEVKIETQRKNDQLISKVDNTEKQLRQVRNDLDEALASKRHLEGQVVHYGNQLDQQGTAMHELQQSMVELKIQGEEAERSQQNNVAKRRLEIKRLQQETTRRRMENERLVSRISSTEETLCLVQKELETSNDLNNHLNRELVRSEEDVLQLKKTKDTALRRADDLAHEANRLTIEIQKRDQNVLQPQDQFLQLQEPGHVTEITQLQDDLRSVRKAKNELECQYRQFLDPLDIPSKAVQFPQPARHLGGGAYGNVSVGLYHGVEVAVKKFHEVIMKGHWKELCLQELSVCQRVRHPNIVFYYGASMENDTPLMLLMELLEGSLADLIEGADREKQALSSREQIDVAADAVAGIAHLHSVRPEPYIHGDIRPTNVLVTRDMRAKIGDLGATHVVGSSLSAGPVSEDYLAPERRPIEGGPPPSRSTKSSDIYSLGCTLADVFSGKLVTRKQRARQIDGIAVRELRKLCHQMTEDESEKRPPARQIFDELQRLKRLGGYKESSVRRHVFRIGDHLSLVQVHVQAMPPQ